MDDSTLLRRYTETGSNEAFAELVSRHLSLVYFAALRQLPHDPQLAQDATQRTFSLLARKARALAHHPALAGWLHTTAMYAAREARRAEIRRHDRERHAVAMSNLLTEPSAASEWERVRPVIDEALRELDPRDREAVLLRFFENRPYAEVGAALHLTANTVRMRVERAVDKLRVALARRGVASTAAALNAALGVPATLAAPAGLAQHVTTATLAGAGAAATSASFLTLLHLMTSAKIIATSTTAAALIAIGLAVQQREKVGTATAAVTALRQQHDERVMRIHELETRLASAESRATAAEARAQQLRAMPGAEALDPLAPPAAPVTRDQVEARHRNAKQLAERGQFAEALSEYLWCYDIGMRQVEGYFIIRYASVLDAIAALGQDYPPALDALRLRRAAAEMRLLASANDMEAGKDYSQINRVLGEDATTYALFDGLGEDDPRRQHLVDSSIGRLMEARRYRELAKAMPYTDLPKVWEELVQVAHNADETVRAHYRRSAIGFAASQVELRAGAGDTIHANDLIERVLVFDDSPETIAAINRHLLRAGRADLTIKP